MSFYCNMLSGVSTSAVGSFVDRAIFDKISKSAPKLKKFLQKINASSVNAFYSYVMWSKKPRKKTGEENQEEINEMREALVEAKGKCGPICKNFFEDLLDYLSS